MRRRNHALWLGPLVVLLGAISYFQVFARFAALRDFPWVNLPLVASGLALSVVAVLRAFRQPTVYRGKILGILGLALSCACAGLFVVYLFVISSLLPSAQAATLALDQAPQFALPDQNGRSVALADLRGKKAVLVFYRGYW